MHNQHIVSAREAREKLQQGNNAFLEGAKTYGDLSLEKRIQTARFGQEPYAIVITCSDARVVPNALFSCGVGDLFVIRVAGNVIDEHQLGSIEYACEHLGVKLVVVLGHDHCGAVDAAIHDNSDEDPEGFIRYIVDDIKAAIGEETDPLLCSRLNVEHSVARIREALVHEQGIPNAVEVAGALYYLESGKVAFLE